MFSLIAFCFLVIFQFQLLTSWGDPYYIGLNGLELFNEHGEQILLTENSILCTPSTAGPADAQFNPWQNVTGYHFHIARLSSGMNSASISLYLGDEPLFNMFLWILYTSEHFFSQWDAPAKQDKVREGKA